MVVCTREFLLLGHVASFSKAEGLDKNGLYLFYYISISEKREGGGGWRAGSLLLHSVTLHLA